MCLLTFLPEETQPDPDALLNGAAANDDGHGYAIVIANRILVHRGLRAEKMIDRFTAARRRHPGGPALFHSRLATHGSTGVANCHPFPVGADERTVLAHNGILPASVQPAEGDPRSDTRITAEQFLLTFGSLRTQRNRRRLERWMGPFNKIVLLTVDPRYRHSAYILNEPFGVWHHGIWYSNDDYRPPRPHRPWLGGASDWADPLPADWPLWDTDDPDAHVGRCPYCRAVIDPADGDCLYCGWCLDCGATAEECTCYPLPAVDRWSARTR